MAARSQLDLAGLLEWLRAAADVLDDHSAALDRLDRGQEWDDGGWDPEPVDPPPVEPDVPAGGCCGPEEPGAAVGSDLALTMAAASAAAQGCSTISALADSLVHGSRAGATGSAGGDLAQVLGGLAESLRNADSLDGGRFAIGLELAAERIALDDDGRHAGCMPAVLAAAADAALAAVDAEADLAEVVIAAADDGLVELESGPRANPELVDRGVVDAAAAGFLLVLDVLASVVTGEPLPAAPVEPVAPAAGDGSSSRFRVRCRIEPHDGCGIESADWLESTWFELGTLVEFVGTVSPWRAELLTVVPGAAIEAIGEVGRPRELHIALAGPAD